MPRRPAVLLTSPHYIPDSSLFLALPALFTLTQEGSLERSCGGCSSCTPAQKSEAHPLPFQPVARSLQKRRVWRQERSLSSLTLNHSTFTPITPLESALTDDLRVLAEISRNRPRATPLESALTRFSFITSLESALTKKPGEGQHGVN